MKRLLFVAMAAAFVGCSSADKSRHLDVAGVYANPSGTFIAGSVESQSAPEGVESAMVAYEDSKAWLSEQKEHDIRILLTGTNAVTSAESIVSNICAAFIATAPALKGGACKCDPCKCDPCKCGKREPSDTPEEPPPSVESI